MITSISPMATGRAYGSALLTKWLPSWIQQFHLHSLIYPLKLEQRPPPNHPLQQWLSRGCLTAVRGISYNLRTGHFQTRPIFPTRVASAITELLCFTWRRRSCSCPRYQTNCKYWLLTTHGHLISNLDEEIHHNSSIWCTFHAPLKHHTLTCPINSTPIPTSQPLNLSL